jgi:RNA polymerase sigma-70 factor (ECF subfamily)
MEFESGDLKEEFNAIERSRRQPEYFEYIYNKHFAKIYRYVKSALNDKQLANDICQDVFYTAMCNLKNFSWTELGIRPWLFGIANNRLRMFFRTSKRVVYLPVDELKLEEIHDGNKHLDLNERREIVSKVLSELSIEEQELIQLRFVAEVSFKEISLMLNITEEACKMRLYRLLDRIKTNFKIL